MSCERVQLDAVLHTLTAALQTTVDEENCRAGLHPDAARERPAAVATGKLGTCLRAALFPSMRILGHAL
jgi:hypothetical protein